MSTLESFPSNITPHPTLEPPADERAMSGLFPALVQCFAIILGGYFAGHFGVISEKHSKGLGTYVTKFALTAVFFRVMLTIDFSYVSWRFVLAISLAKAVMFLVTLGVTLLLQHPMNLALSGLLAIFTSQSNDVALGFPILESLFPNHAKYIYLFAPAQLVFLNPIGFMLMEWQAVKDAHNRDLERQFRQRSGQDESTLSHISQEISLPRRFLIVLRNVLLNPLVFMTIIGVGLNLLLQHKIPEIVDRVLRLLAESFPATALFYLGHGMVNKMGTLTRRSIHILALILLAKQVLLPFVMRELVRMVDPGMGDVNATLDYTTVAFLYGSLPTAPPVYLFAVQFNLIPEVIATALVVGTFLTAPLMYVSARLVTIGSAPQYWVSSTSFDMSILSLLSAVWVLIVWVLSRRIFRVPHQVSACWLVSCALACIGMLLDRVVHGQSYRLERNPSVNTNQATLAHYIQFVIFFVGAMGARLWTVVMALCVVIIRWRGPCCFIKWRFYLYLCGWSVPFLITGILLMISPPQTESDIDPAYQYGRAQTVVSLLVLLFSFISTAVMLIVFVRLDKHSDNRFSSAEEHPESTASESEPLTQDDSQNSRRSLLHSNSSGSRPSTTADQREVEEWRTTSSVSPHKSAHSHCPPEECLSSQRRECSRLLGQHRHQSQSARSHVIPQSSSSTNADISSTPTSPEGSLDDMQLYRHAILLVVLLFSMSMGIFLCIWRLVKETMSGIYIELEFLNSFFNFGQGFLAFVVFGLDTDLVIIPCWRRIRRLIYGAEEATTSDNGTVRVRRGRSVRKDSHVDCRKSLINDQRRRIMF